MMMLSEWSSIYQRWKETGQVAEEEAMFRYIKKKYPEWISQYETCLARARQTVLKRTVEGFLRENIGGMAQRLVKQLPPEWRNPFPSSYRYLAIKEDQWLVFPIEKRFAFYRYPLRGRLWLATSTALKPIEHVVEWLALIDPILSQQVRSDHWKQLIQELCNAVANQTLAYLWQEIKVKKQKQQGEEPRRFIERLSKMQDPSLYFEQLCVEGHHLHPCAKTKLDLQPEEVDQYSPECRNESFLQFVAVKQGWVESTWEKDAFHTFLVQSFPELLDWVEPFARDGYLLIPVHEWQMKRVIPSVYQEEIEKKIVMPIPRLRIPASATSSFRTLVPFVQKETPSELNVKVAVNSQMTSTIRSISPQTAINSKTFSWLMEEVLKREPALKEKLVPIPELGGCCFKSPDPLKSRNLSVVFREAVKRKKGEIPIVASSLLSDAPETGRPVIHDLLAWYACNNGIQSEQEVTERFLFDYMRIILSCYLPLMVKYGIGLEGHMQNSIPVFREGRPVRLMVRDWGGARIYYRRLQQQGIDLDFYPHSLTVTSNIEKMYEKMFYTVYVSHLGELILQWSDRYGLSEAKLWKNVREISEEVLATIAQDPKYSEAVKLDHAFLFQTKVPLKALTTMRLFPDRECYVLVPNPLSPNTSS